MEVKYKAEDPPATVAQTTQELEEFMTLSLPDKELEEVVAYEMGSAYYPPGSGQTYRQWLEEVLAILKKPHDEEATLRLVS